MTDWCSYCDFKEYDDDPQDCTCVDNCGDEECSGDTSDEKTN